MLPRLLFPVLTALSLALLAALALQAAASALSPPVYRSPWGEVTSTTEAPPR